MLDLGTWLTSDLELDLGTWLTSDLELDLGTWLTSDLELEPGRWLGTYDKIVLVSGLTAHLELETRTC